MSAVECTCQHCGTAFTITTGHYNRAMKIGARLYCGRACSGLARRLANPPTLQEKKAAKAEYDKLRRREKRGEIKAKKAAYFQRTYDPAKAAIERKARSHMHVAYCRRPEYKAWKQEYDMRHRARKQFGDYAEASLILRGIEQEIEARTTRYETYKTNGTLNKAQTRRRSL